MSDRWIVVRNWKEYQHPDVLRTKTPAWIKLSTSIAHDQEFMELNLRRRAILLQLFVEYAMSRGQLTDNTRTLSQRLHGRVTNADIQAFVHAGFITLSASKPASNHASRPASLDKRREEEKEQQVREEGSPPLDNGLPADHLELNQLMAKATPKTIEEGLR